MRRRPRDEDNLATAKALLTRMTQTGGEPDAVLDTMPSDSSLSALRRMAGSAAPSAPAAEAAPAPGLERALATAALRVGNKMPGMGLGARGRHSRQLDAVAAFDGFEDNALCLMIDPPEFTPEQVAAQSQDTLAALTGLIVVPPSVTDSLVEVQTIGRVDGPCRTTRRPTRIDAALVQPFARSLLEQVQRLAPAGTAEPRVGTLRTGSFLAGPASLSLVLTARRYIRIDLELEMGDGVRSGTISVLLPMAERAMPQVGSDIDPEARWKAAMHATAMDAPVLLQAVLPPLRLPLSKLLSLKVGDVIPLPQGTLADVRLHGGTSGVTHPGRTSLPRGTSMVARLGQLNGVRAVKITALPGEAPRDPEEMGPGGFGGMPESLPDDGDAQQVAVAAAAAALESARDAMAGDRRGAPAAAMASRRPGGKPDLSDLAALPDLPDLPDLP